MRRIAVLLVVLMFACKEKPQTAETSTGNATDRNAANGTSGTGTPAPLSTGTVTATSNLATATDTTATVQTMTGAKTTVKKKKH